MTKVILEKYLPVKSMSAKLIKRFWSKVDIRTAMECWPWKTGKSGDGYGEFCVNGKNLPAHRVSYVLTRGNPTKLFLDHLCRNRACVNPIHLESVTLRENILRGSGLTARHALTKTCPRGHPYSGSNLYIAPKNGHRDCKECATLRRQGKA